MKRNLLGNTGIEVTELCFGALPMGPLQANISEEEGARLIIKSLESGINFIDTAEKYLTYPHIRKALDQFNSEVVLATKSPAQSYVEMEKSIQEALKALNRNYIDIFLLHAARVEPSVFEQRAGAIQCLMDYKAKGYLRAIGISTHAASVVRKAAEISELDIVFPIINKLGMGIVGGSLPDMLTAIEEVRLSGKGLYAMKALAGGHLIDNLVEAFDFVRKIPGIVSVAVGMVNSQELEVNLKIFNNEELPVELLASKKTSKKLFISNFCKGCGACVKACPSGALSVQDKRAAVDRTLCILCGYCNPVCSQFALRLI